MQIVDDVNAKSGFFTGLNDNLIKILFFGETRIFRAFLKSKNNGAYQSSNSKSKTGSRRRKRDFEAIGHKLKESIPILKRQVACQGTQVIEKGFASA